MVSTRPTRCGQRGFLMAASLLLLLLMGLFTLTLVRKWEHEDRVAKERDLLWIGAQFRAALASYANATPIGMAEAPRQLEELLRDRRGPQEIQHLRRLYLDPMTGKADWALVRSVRGTIAGIHSTSQGRPMVRDGLWPVERQFADAKRYADWVFAPSPWLMRTTTPMAPAPAPAAESAPVQ